MSVRTEIWAHRGASLHAPENTLSAFEEAVRLGADGIELDVQRSSDNHLVVTHDASLERTAGVQSQVSQMTLQALKKLNMGIAKADSTVHAIPTLSEVFQLLRPTALKVNVELKDPTDLNFDMAAAVLKLACDYQMTDRIILSSFNHYSLHHAMQLIRKQNLTTTCGILYQAGLYQPWIYAQHVGVSAIHPFFPNLLIPDLVTRCHEAGICVHPWTIDEPKYIYQAIQLNVDAIITNNVEQAIAIRQQLVESQA